MKKTCYFCKNKTNPDFLKPEILEKFLSPRKKIISRDKTGICAKHQRHLAKSIKRARFLALIPYVSYQSAR